LLLLVSALQIQYSFELRSTYFRTYHNVNSDAFTRLEDAEVEELRQRLGLTSVDLHDAWAQHLSRGWVRRALVWEGQDAGDTKTALQLSEKRIDRGLPRTLTGPGHRTIVVLEWRGTIGTYAKAALQAGCDAWMLAAPHGPAAGGAVWPSGVRMCTTQDLPECDIVLASLTEDDGEEARRWAGIVVRTHAAVAYADAPRHAGLGPARGVLERAGYCWEEATAVASAHGDVVARRRTLILVGKKECNAPQPPDHTYEVGPGCQSILMKTTKLPKEAWLGEGQGTLTLAPGMGRQQDAWGALMCGQFAPVGTKGRPLTVLSPGGPLPTLRLKSCTPGPDGVVVLQPGGPGPGVRFLQPEEVWRAQGGTGASWTKGRVTEAEETMLSWAVRACPPEMAKAVLKAALVSAQEQAPRSGVCAIRQEDYSWKRLQDWLAAWRKNPERPSDAAVTGDTLEEDNVWLTGKVGCITEEEDAVACSGGILAPYGQGCRVGLNTPLRIGVGSRSQEEAQLGEDEADVLCRPGDSDTDWTDGWLEREAGSRLEDRESSRRVGAPPLVRPVQLRGPYGAKLRHPAGPLRVSEWATKEEWEKEKFQVVLDRLEGSSKAAYQVGWRWWTLFCRRRELEPFRRVTEANRQAEENLVLDFLLHLVRNAHKSPSSARQYLGAIRNMHVSLGLPEPFADMSRVKFTMEGFKKRDKGKERRRPFTPAMLRWVWRNSRPRESQDDAAIWFALCLGYFYLLRSREYTHCEGHTALGNKGLRGVDVTWRKNWGDRSQH